MLNIAHKLDILMHYYNAKLSFLERDRSSPFTFSALRAAQTLC